LKIAHHTKNQGNHSLSEKRQSIDANIEINQTLELPDKDFKVTIIKITSVIK